MKFAISAGTGFNAGAFTRDMNQRLQRAAKRATDQAAAGALQDIRSTMRGQRLGRLANAVQQTSDQKKGRIQDRGDGGWSASGVVYARPSGERVRGAIKAYTEGAVIRAKKGRWLAIPTGEIPSRIGRKKITPELWARGGLNERIGVLHFVPTRKPGIAMLVAQGVSVNPLRARSARRLPKSGRPRAGRVAVSVVAFILIRQTRRSKRFDPHEIAARWQARVPRLMQAALSR